MTKSALGIDPAEYGVSDPMHAWRIRKSRREAERREVVFFRNNLARRHFIRKSLPFEADGWGADRHKAAPTVLVRWLIDSEQMHRIYLKADPSTLLNTEEFCKALYEKLLQSNASQLSPEEHAALLEAAGIEVTRGEGKR